MMDRDLTGPSSRRGVAYHKLMGESALCSTLATYPGIMLRDATLRKLAGNETMTTGDYEATSFASKAVPVKPVIAIESRRINALLDVASHPAAKQVAEQLRAELAGIECNIGLLDRPIVAQASAEKPIAGYGTEYSD